MLDERENRTWKTTEIERIDKGRYVNHQSVTCSMYRPGRKNDPVSAANANPVIAGLIRRIAHEEGVAVVDNTNVDRALAELMRLVLDAAGRAMAGDAR